MANPSPTPTPLPSNYTIADLVSYFFGGQITQGYGPPGEIGVDVGGTLGAGMAIYNPLPGIVDAASTPYRVIVDLLQGGQEVFQHVTESPQLAPGTLLGQGALVGVVSPLTGSDVPAGYTSSGPHLEFGYFPSSTAASFSGSADPFLALSAARAAGAPGYAQDASGNPTPVPVPGPNPPGSAGAGQPGGSPPASNPLAGIWGATLGGLFNINLGQDFSDLAGLLGLSIPGASFDLIGKDFKGIAVRLGILVVLIIVAIVLIGALARGGTTVQVQEVKSSGSN